MRATYLPTDAIQKCVAELAIQDGGSDLEGTPTTPPKSLFEASSSVREMCENGIRLAV